MIWQTRRICKLEGVGVSDERARDARVTSSVQQRADSAFWLSLGATLEVFGGREGRREEAAV